MPQPAKARVPFPLLERPVWLYLSREVENVYVDRTTVSVLVLYDGNMEIVLRIIWGCEFAVKHPFRRVAG